MLRMRVVVLKVVSTTTVGTVKRRSGRAGVEALCVYRHENTEKTNNTILQERRQCCGWCPPKTQKHTQ
jgi:hypothetical protein